MKIDERNMSFAKKRKVNQENRQFKTEWTDKYCFSLPDHANAKPKDCKHVDIIQAVSFF